MTKKAVSPTVWLLIALVMAVVVAVVLFVALGGGTTPLQKILKGSTAADIRCPAAGTGVEGEAKCKALPELCKWDGSKCIAKV